MVAVVGGRKGYGATGERLAFVANDSGVFRCHTIFNCQQVCPKDLDPTGAIGKLKMKSGGDYGDFEFTMTRVEKEE